MPPELRYWDSNCFIGWLAEEPDKIDECKAVIEAAEAGRVRIVTSALTIAEVVKLRHKRPIPPEDAAKVRGFFRQSYILIRGLDRFIAEDAQALVWDRGIDPKDAVHVATALVVNAVQLDTFDGPLMLFTGTLGSPPLLIGRPVAPPPPDAASPEAGDQQELGLDSGSDEPVDELLETGDPE